MCVWVCVCVCVCLCLWADKIDVSRGNSNFSLLCRVGRRPAVIGFSSTSLHHNNNLILASQTHTSSLPPARAALHTPVLLLFKYTHTGPLLHRLSCVLLFAFLFPSFCHFHSLSTSSSTLPLHLSFFLSSLSLNIVFLVTFSLP